MIKCLIFDLDDTVYYEKTYVLEALKNVCKYLSNKYTISYNKIYKRCVEILNECGRGKIFNILCNEYKLKENINDLVEMYRDTKPNIKLYEESNEIFKYAKENKIRLGIITDGCSKVQWNKITSLGIEKIVDKIIVTDDYGLGYGKPHEKSYKEMLEYFNVEPSECIYIGDNPNKDFVGAKELGMKTIRIIHDFGDHINDEVSIDFEAELVVKKLIDILTVL